MKDPIIEEIENKLKSIVNLYKSKGWTTHDLRVHFSNPKNFNKIVKMLGDIHYIYNENRHIIKFETRVYDLLFFGTALMERIYCECDDEDEF